MESVSVEAAGRAPDDARAQGRGPAAFRGDGFTRERGGGAVLVLDTRDEIGVLRMQYGKANVQDLEFCTALAERMAEIEKLPSRALVIIGHGAFFSGGVDLKRISAGGTAYLREFMPALVRCFESVFFHPKPVVCAVNGHAVAGGCLLACCGDRRLMVDDDRAGIGVPELHVGVPFPPAALEILRFACAPQHLQKLICGGQSLRPGAALEAGLVDTLVPPDALESEAIETAKRLARVRPEVFAVTKRQLRDPVRSRIRANDEAAGADTARLWTSPATVAAVETYTARTLGRRERS